MKIHSRFGFGIMETKRTAALALVLPVCGFFASATPFVPSHDGQVLERVRVSSAAPAARELRAVRAKLARDPDSLADALQFANDCLVRARAEADARFLGQAERALDRWFRLNEPPASVLVVRAHIRQSNHDFATALADLDAALRLDPRNAQAWLIRANVLQVQGRYAEAKKALLPLMRLASQLVSVTCASSLASLTGEAEKGYALLSHMLGRDSTAPVEEKLWATTTLAEMAVRLGKMSDAEDHFRAALVLGPGDVYLLGAFADFLLDQGRPAEVIPLLQDKSQIDALLLRLALAERLDGNERQAESHISALRERFAASRLRGNNVHQREEARFRLHLANEPREAVRLALANWQVQREPADLRILLEAALAADDQAAGDRAVTWLRETRFEDARLAGLVGSFEQKQKARPRS
jgi:tetratricopeptide (TPR) repeat protein